MTNLIPGTNGPEMAAILQNLLNLPKPPEDCCGIPGCDHEPPGHEPPGLEHQVVLIDAAAIGQGAVNQRLEAFVLSEHEQSVKIRFKNGTEGYYATGVVIDELGPATSVQYDLFGVEKPEAPPTPDYQTGTYVAPTQDGLFLVEVDRVGDQYYIHAVGDSGMEPLTPEVWENLDNFSDPDGPGNYVLAPGPYYVAKLKRMIEVIPHGGYSYYRFIDDCQLTRLAPGLVQDCVQIESDTFEVNAIMVMPQDIPRGLTQGLNKGLNNAEDRPTGCCQAAPREEPREEPREA